jgi:hypothetical protein
MRPSDYALQREVRTGWPTNRCFAPAWGAEGCFHRAYTWSHDTSGCGHRVCDSANMRRSVVSRSSSQRTWSGARFRYRSQLRFAAVIHARRRGPDRMIRTMLISFLLLGAYSGYASVLATVALVQDATLTALQKATRTAAVWVLPLVGSTLALRSVYDVSPTSLPGRAWLLPLKPLLYVPRHRRDYSDDGSDLFQASQRQLPGQSFHNLS